MSAAGLSGAALAASLVAAAACAIALYHLRPPPRRYVVGSLAIWRRALGAAATRREWWRYWLSVALAALIAASLALSWAHLRRDDGRVLVVIDNGRSSQAGDPDGTTRFARAVGRARALIGEASDVLLADTCASIDSRVFLEPRVAEAQLAALQPCDLPGRMPVVPGGGDRRVFVGDGVDVAAPQDFERSSVFTPALNVGISAFGIRRPRGGVASAFLALRNDGEHGVDVEVELVSGGRRVRGREHLAARASVGRTVDLDASGFTSGTVVARIHATGDSYSLDDVRTSRMPPRAIHVTLGENPHALLAGAVAALPGVDTGVPPDVAITASGEPIGALPSIAFIATEPLPISGSVRLVPHPVVAGVAADDFVGVPATPIVPRKGDVVLVHSDGGAIVVVNEGAHTVRIGAALEPGGFAATASFPLLLDGAVSWLASRDGRTGGVEVPVVRGVNDSDFPVSTDLAPPDTPRRRSEPWRMWIVVTALAVALERFGYLRRWTV